MPRKYVVTIWSLYAENQQGREVGSVEVKGGKWPPRVGFERWAKDNIDTAEAGVYIATAHPLKAGEKGKVSIYELAFPDFTHQSRGVGTHHRGEVYQIGDRRKDA